VPAERAVVLAYKRLELPAMCAARVSLRAVHASTMPGEPPARFGVYVLTMAEIQELPFQRDLRLGIRAGTADLAPKYDRDGHQCPTHHRRS
jgi:hypothetical protein